MTEQDLERFAKTLASSLPSPAEAKRMAADALVAKEEARRVLEEAQRALDRRVEAAWAAAGTAHLVEQMPLIRKALSTPTGRLALNAVSRDHYFMPPKEEGVAAAKRGWKTRREHIPGCYDDTEQGQLVGIAYRTLLARFKAQGGA
jgi:hypothetical protein